MELNVKTSDILIRDVATTGNFAKQVREQTGNKKFSTQLVAYHMKKGTIDYIVFGSFKLVVLNEKAEKFIESQKK